MKVLKEEAALACFIVSVKEYDWTTDENLFAKTNRDSVFLIRQKFQKCLTQLQNIFTFSAMHHIQAHIKRDFLTRTPVRIIAPCLDRLNLGKAKVQHQSGFTGLQSGG